LFLFLYAESKPINNWILGLKIAALVIEDAAEWCGGSLETVAQVLNYYAKETTVSVTLLNAPDSWTVDSIGISLPGLCVW